MPKQTPSVRLKAVWRGNMETIKALICAEFSVPLSSLSSRSRLNQDVMPRHIAMFLCRDLTSASLCTIAKAFGRKDHTTTINAVAHTKRMFERDPALLRRVNALSDKYLSAKLGKNA